MLHFSPMPTTVFTAFHLLLLSFMLHDALTVLTFSTSPDHRFSSLHLLQLILKTYIFCYSTTTNGFWKKKPVTSKDFDAQSVFSWISPPPTHVLATIWFLFKLTSFSPLYIFCDHSVHSQSLKKKLCIVRQRTEKKNGVHTRRLNYSAFSLDTPSWDKSCTCTCVFSEMPYLSFKCLPKP